MTIDYQVKNSKHKIKLISFSKSKNRPCTQYKKQKKETALQNDDGIDKENIKNSIRKRENSSKYLLRRAQYLESRANELFSLVAHKESEKRILKNFLNKVENIEDEKLDLQSKVKKIKELKDKFLEDKKLFIELGRYLSKDSTAKEYLINLLTKDDLDQIKLMAKAITGSEALAEKLLISDKNLFVTYVQNRRKFLGYTSYLFSQIQKMHTISSSSIEEVVRDTKEFFDLAS